MNTQISRTNIIPETPNPPQKDINIKKSVRRIIESEAFDDNISGKMKIEGHIVV